MDGCVCVDGCLDICVFAIGLYGCFVFVNVCVIVCMAVRMELCMDVCVDLGKAVSYTHR